MMSLSPSKKIDGEQTTLTEDGRTLMIYDGRWMDLNDRDTRQLGLLMGSSTTEALATLVLPS